MPKFGMCVLHGMFYLLILISTAASVFGLFGSSAALITCLQEAVHACIALPDPNGHSFQEDLAWFCRLAAG